MKKKPYWLVLIVLAIILIYLLRTLDIIPNNTEAFFWISAISFWLIEIYSFIQNKTKKH